MKLTGRVLHLVADPANLRAQLDGGAPDVAGQDYHYGVNTDAMISGRACTLGYTGEILGPYFLENFLEAVAKDDVRSGGFQASRMTRTPKRAFSERPGRRGAAIVVYLE